MQAMRPARVACFACGLALLVGCQARRQVHNPDFAHLGRATYQAACAPQTVLPLAPADTSLAGPQPVDLLVRRALSQNAAVHAARNRLEAVAMRVPQAASLKDPMLSVTGWPFYPFTPQTASGRMTTDLMVSQEVPWPGKLGAQAAAAEAEVNAARAQLAAAELKVIEEVKRAYYELFYVQRAIRVVTEDREILADLAEVAEARYRTGDASQQEVLRLQAELSNVAGELLRIRQQRDASQAELARQLHVSPETPLEAVAELSPADAPRDLESLYEQAVRGRPELHAALAAIDRDQLLVERARLDYLPDLDFRFGWGAMTTYRAVAASADGIDNLGVGLGANIPIYRKRLSSAVREAEENTLASARQYDQLKDETQRDVKQLFTQAVSQRDTEALFRESIIPKTRQALAVAVRAYQVGDVEFADLIANWRELLRFHLAHLQLEAQYRQTLASLERVVGGLATIPSPVPAAAPSPERLPAPSPDAARVVPRRQTDLARTAGANRPCAQRAVKIRPIPTRSAPCQLFTA